MFSFFYFTSVVFAQTTGGFQGTVSDIDGQPIAGVTITITGNALIGQKRIAFTNESGVFRFPSLPIGTYDAEVTLRGFQTLQTRNIKVNSGITTNLPFTISPTTSETILVMSESFLINPTQSGFNTTFNTEMLEKLPSEGTMFELMQQAPGMSTDGGAGNSQPERIVAFGSNRQSNSWNIDGANTTGPETGHTWVTANPELISEIQVNGIGTPAEFGNFSGAVLNVVTKSGTNNFHGGAHFDYQSDALTDVNVGPPETPYVYHRVKYQDIDAVFGGPIAKDRIWFYGGVQSFRGKFTPPDVPPDIFAPLNRSNKYDLKISARIATNNELTASIHDEEYHFTDIPNSLVAPSALGDEYGTNPAWRVSLNKTVSSNLHLEFDYSGFWGHDLYGSSTGNHDTPVAEYIPSDNTWVSSGSTVFPFDYVTYSHHANAKATYYADSFLKSEHEFKFGIQYYYGSADTLIAYGPQGFNQFIYNGSIYQYQQVPYHYGGIADGMGLFIDDTVTINRQLTLNLGLRYDHDRGSLPDYPRMAIGTPSVSDVGDFTEAGEMIPGVHNLIRWDSVTPRLGFAWQPRANGNSVIRGAFGIYRDGNIIGNWDSPPPERPLSQGLLIDPATGNSEVFWQDTPLDFANNMHIRQPKTYQYSVGYEQQIGSQNSFGIQYLHKDVRDLVGWNITGGTYEPFLFTDPFTGKEYTLLNIIDHPLLQKGNDPGDFPGSEGLRWFQTYDGLIFTYQGRFSNKFLVNASYTWSKSYGLLPRPLSQIQFNPFYGNREGSDPNAYINAKGPLQGDRPNMFRLQGIFSRLPGGIQASTVLDFSSGRAYTRQIRVPLNQGGKNVIMEHTTAQRYAGITNINLAINKQFGIGNGMQLDLNATIFNLLNSDHELIYQTLVLQSPSDVLRPAGWVWPRRLQIGLGFQF